LAGKRGSRRFAGYGGREILFGLTLRVGEPGSIFGFLGFLGFGAVIKPAIVQQTNLPAVLLLKSGH
jgi:hypothetical protein